MDEAESQETLVVEQETPAENTFIAPSISPEQILTHTSYTYHSAIPAAILENKDTECVLGVDEAGRGPVLGPMVYGLLYLPLSQHRSLLAETHHFDDSKVLTPAVRSSLLSKLCTPGTDLFASCGWATRVMSARDISAAMFQPAVYNLNAQAMDATIALIRGVLDAGVNVREIYIDTIGKPEIYQRKLERVFPAISITVAKKADSLYPCVSAASVCAKVTRDAALETAYKALTADGEGTSAQGWGSGYPSDARCVNWLKGNVDPVFGWGGECRFSWGTAKDLLEKRDWAWNVEWPEESGGEGMVALSEYFKGKTEMGDEVAGWWGKTVEEVMI